MNIFSKGINLAKTMLTRGNIPVVKAVPIENVVETYASSKLNPLYVDVRDTFYGTREVLKTSNPNIGNKIISGSNDDMAESIKLVSYETRPKTKEFKVIQDYGVNGKISYRVDSENGPKYFINTTSNDLAKPKLWHIF